MLTQIGDIAEIAPPTGNDGGLCCRSIHTFSPITNPMEIKSSAPAAAAELHTTVDVLMGNLKNPIIAATKKINTFWFKLLMDTRYLINHILLDRSRATSKLQLNHHSVPFDIAYATTNISLYQLSIIHPYLNIMRFMGAYLAGDYRMFVIIVDTRRTCSYISFGQSILSESFVFKSILIIMPIFGFKI